MSKVENFIHFHVHSDQSQLDGCAKISSYVEEAAKRGAPAITITDHGTMRGYYQLLLECQKHKIKPIYGIEFYVALDMRRKGLTDEERDDITKGLKRAEAKQAIKDYEDRHSIRDRWHVTAWAKNAIGLKNLYKLSSMAYTDGFYYKPRIDLKALMEHGEGLAIGTGCLASPIYDRVTSGKRRLAWAVAEQLRERFGKDLWLEIMPHDIKDQVIANKFVLEMKDKWGKHAQPLATQDAHYVHQEDAPAHAVLLCIGTNDKLSNPDRFQFDGDEFFMKTRQQMWDSFKRHHNSLPDHFIKEALDNTLMLNEQIESDIIKIDRFKCLMPELELPPEYGDGEDAEYAYLKDLCVQGWSWRGILDRAATYAKHANISTIKAIQVYTDRLKMELKALKIQKFVGYFLLVYDLYQFARSKDIACGPGRGSAAGSIVSFLVGITSVDPIEHGLIFERFISPSRIDMPDIDMDFEDVRRHEIIDYLREKYGEDRVCQIATVGKLSGKACLKDVSRVLEVPLVAVSAVTNSILERSSGDERASMTIEDSFKEFKVCREFNKKYPDVLKYAKRLEGMAKTLGIHAAGVITSPQPLTELIPLEVRKHEGKDIKVSAVDMYGVAAMGLLKLDVLGLRTLTVLKDCVKAIKERHGVDIDLESLPLDDKKTLDGFTEHDYTGIFQYDSPGADKICSGVNFEHFNDVVAMVALNRPGTARSGLATQYVERKKHPELISQTSMHESVSKITADTLGIIVYQEHVLKIFTQVAGFEPATADSLRQKIAKKWGNEMIGKERENFIKGAMDKTGMDAKTAGKIIDAITFFGSYGFNRSHSTAYSTISYWGMWLKKRYPLEFYWALLKNEPARIRIQQIAKDAKRHDIELLPPSVSVSKGHFAIDSERGAIRGSLVDIKGVGEAAATSIREYQPFKGVFDFLGRVDRRKCHKGVVLALVKAGAMDDLLPNIKWFVENVEDFWKVYNKKDAKALKQMIEASSRVPDYADEERQLLASSVSPLAFGRHPIDAYQDFTGKHVKVSIAAMSDEDFFKRYDGESVYVAGVIVEVKYNQVGDFHTGALPSEDERRKQFWGARYANINVEDAGGKQNRIKIDFDIFDDFRDVVDSGIGTPVIVHALVNFKFENLRGHFIVNLESYRKKIEAKQPLAVWEAVLDGQHPTIVYPWKPGRTEYTIKDGTKHIVKNLDNRVYNRAFFDEASEMFVGVVINVRLKYDKRDNEMAFFGMMGGDGRFIDCICFGSNWTKAVKKVIKAGQHMKIQLDREYSDNRWQYFFSGGKIKLYRKSASHGVLS